jgi:hypothetical protein
LSAVIGIKNEELIRIKSDENAITTDRSVVDDNPSRNKPGRTFARSRRFEKHPERSPKNLARLVERRFFGRGAISSYPLRSCSSSSTSVLFAPA